jgi:hypothetical protein
MASTVKVKPEITSGVFFLQLVTQIIPSISSGSVVKSAFFIV